MATTKKKHTGTELTAGTLLLVGFLPVIGFALGASVFVLLNVITSLLSNVASPLMLPVMLVYGVLLVIMLLMIQRFVVRARHLLRRVTGVVRARQHWNQVQMVNTDVAVQRLSDSADADQPQAAMSRDGQRERRLAEK